MADGKQSNLEYSGTRVCNVYVVCVNTSKLFALEWVKNELLVHGWLINLLNNILLISYHDRGQGSELRT